MWTTVLTGTLPASRSACAATLIAPHATARALTTATCVATREPSVTTESVCPSATATLTMTRSLTNASVGNVCLHWLTFTGAKRIKRNSDVSWFS